MELLTAGLIITVSIILGVVLTQGLFMMVFSAARFATTPRRKGN